MSSKGDTLILLNDLLADGYSVVEITSDTQTIRLSLESPNASETIRLSREDARRMLGNASKEAHPLLV